VIWLDAVRIEHFIQKLIWLENVGIEHFDITIDLIGWSPNWAVRLIYSCKVLQSYLQVCGIYNKFNTKKYERRFKCLH
jgi:hypothetical protein